MIPRSTYYPESIDTDQNLFVVHDALRMVLAEDYNPGDTSIRLDGDPNVLINWPQNGFITLTDQCNDLENRATSFYYSSVDIVNFTISGLEILPGFNDIVKPKRLTNVTENVMADHHNRIKDSLIAIQEFLGTEGTNDFNPLGETMEGRINFLRRIVLTPKAYFTVDRRIGLVPFTVNFKDLSFRLGTDGTTGDIKFVWDFGDHTISTVSTTISATSYVDVNDIDVMVQDLDGNTIQKTYSTPNIYTVKLTVSNKYGSDTIIWPDLINARSEAPQEAVVNFSAIAGQTLLRAGSPSGGPYTTTPVIRVPTNSLVSLEIPTGENPSNLGYSYAGEKLNNNTPIDPIVTYTWSLGDDLNHNNLSSSTKASYSYGGYYDMKLRVDTGFGSYRITSYSKAIDVIERTNLWLWVFNTANTVTAYEFGLFSETFKTAGTSSYFVNRNHSFLNGHSNANQMIKEFKKNTGSALTGTTSSGLGGDIILYYASGRNQVDSPATETINFTKFNGFENTYNTSVPAINRPWNWASFSSLSNTYFLFGATQSTPIVNTSPTNSLMQTYNQLNGITSTTTLTNANFRNGAEELLENIATYNGLGAPNFGHISVYRSSWKGNTGYLLRNDGIGNFFRIKSFYKTEGSVGSPLQFISKLVDMPGETKLEGELVNLTQGVYFFNNSGSIAAYNDLSGIWETATGAVTNTVSFRSFQDTSIINYDNLSNTLLAASDGDKKVYLSYDYSSSAFVRFHSGEGTFISLGTRPPGNQWEMTIY